VTLSPAPWSTRAVLVSVGDLARSVSFYRSVFALHEVGREGEVVVLEDDGRSFAFLLREVPGQGVHHGRQELGPRAIAFDVKSHKELDAVAGRLEAAAALVHRAPLEGDESFDVVTGRDPDGLPLLFVSYEAHGRLDADHYRRVALHMYGVDL
jgi:catechol 2,3-dioxygenase-like lactoylglutathione lyase family enzyme